MVGKVKTRKTPKGDPSDVVGVQGNLDALASSSASLSKLFGDEGSQDRARTMGLEQKAIDVATRVGSTLTFVFLDGDPASFGWVLSRDDGDTITEWSSGDSVPGNWSPDDKRKAVMGVIANAFVEIELLRRSATVKDARHG